MGIELSILFTYVGIIIMILIVGRLFLWPMKSILKLVCNSIVGMIVILVFNGIGDSFDLMIPLNFLNALIIGVLGLPGAIFLLIICL